MSYEWRDIETGRITVTAIDRCPPGHVRHAPRVVRVPFHMMDSTQKDIAMHASFDTAGPTRISDATAVSDALAAAPAGTNDLAFKTMQAIGFAKSAVGGPRAALDNHVSQLRAFARSYATHGFHAVDASAKDACSRASNAISATADALEAMANG